MSIDGRAPAARVRWTLTLVAASIGTGLLSCLPALADDAAAGPCAAANAAALADRPGTGRTTSTGGSPCVVPLGGVIIESGFRRQVTDQSGGGNTLASSWLTLIRVGIARRFEFAVAPPSNESRSIFGTSTFDAARGATDVMTAAKYLVIDTPRWQASVGAAYSAPTGSGEFTAGLPTFGVSANLGFAITPRLAVSTSQVVGTSIGSDAQGQSRSYFIAAPSFTIYLDTVPPTKTSQLPMILLRKPFGQTPPRSKPERDGPARRSQFTPTARCSIIWRCKPAAR